MIPHLLGMKLRTFTRLRPLALKRIGTVNSDPDLNVNDIIRQDLEKIIDAIILDSKLRERMKPVFTHPSITGTLRPGPVFNI